jgi:hypothetical protein
MLKHLWTVSEDGISYVDNSRPVAQWQSATVHFSNTESYNWLVGIAAVLSISLSEFVFWLIWERLGMAGGCGADRSVVWSHSVLTNKRRKFEINLVARTMPKPNHYHRTFSHFHSQPRSDLLASHLQLCWCLRKGRIKINHRYLNRRRSSDWQTKKRERISHILRRK